MATTAHRLALFAGAVPRAIPRGGRGKARKRGVVALLEAIRQRPDLPPEAREIVLAHAGRGVAREHEEWRPRFVPPPPGPYTYAERDAARRAWGEARRKRQVVPPDACECCDRAGVPLQGHHTDYRRALQVVWLCTRCHGLAHGGPRPAHLANERAA